MKFSNLQYAYLFWLIPILIVFYFWAFRYKRRTLETFAEAHLIPSITTTVSFLRQKIKAFLTVVAVFFLILALIGPKWGFRWQEAKRRGIDIMVAIDTSKSMLTEDVKPNRLERAKLAVKDLLNLLTGDRIGLIAFAGTAFVQCPLTLDYGAFSLTLNRIDTNTIPRGGTNLASAILTAMDAFETKGKKYKALIIITDGESHEGDPEGAAKKAAEAGIKIFCVGIGTKEGELITITDERGNRTFLKDRNGQVVKSKLDEVTLQKIALATGGSYVKASGAEFGLDIIYKEKIAKMEKKELESKMQKRYEERFQIPLIIAFLLIVIETFINDGRNKYKEQEVKHISDKNLR
ncbi:MAG: VWA domain-containing protein [Candidatus Poribacteria bacterium]